MEPVVAAAGCLLAYVLVYRFYARYLGARIFRLDPTRSTPAHEMEDGVDYVPCRRVVLFGHHYASIAGLAPMLGPAIAVIWGWLPGMLWVVLGDAVHRRGARFRGARRIHAPPRAQYRQSGGRSDRPASQVDLLVDYLVPDLPGDGRLRARRGGAVHDRLLSGVRVSDIHLDGGRHGDGLGHLQALGGGRKDNGGRVRPHAGVDRDRPTDRQAGPAHRNLGADPTGLRVRGLDAAGLAAAAAAGLPELSAPLPRAGRGVRGVFRFAA